MPEILLTVGFVILLIGIFLIVISALQGGNAKVAVGGFIGPFPFGFANDPRMLQLIIALTLIIAVVFILFAIK